jgi:uncharacterized membrane protein
MKSIAFSLFAYVAFLILAGLAGYLSNPEKAKTALMSGGTFGLLSIALAVLALRGWRPVIGAALGVGGFLALTFIWRSSVSWMAVAGGQQEKMFAAILITTMLVGTVAMIGLVLRARQGLAQPPVA